jgi:hypothetical protein
MSQTIVFQVDAEGNVVYDMAGFQGDMCLQAAEALLEELARLGVEAEVTEVRHKEGDDRVHAGVSIRA